MNARCAIETFSSYSPQEKTDFLLQFAYTLTIVEEGLSKPSRLINEVLHQVISFLMALINNEGKRYPDEKFVRIILEHPEDLELQRQLQEAFDHLEAGAALHPKCSHTASLEPLRATWRQLLWNAEYPFPSWRTRRAIETFSGYSTQEKTEFVLQFAHTVTILARDTYREEGLTNPSRLRLINEVQHRVIRFLMGLINNEEKRYADEEFVRIILWRPEDLELQQQLREAFDVMAQVVAGISEARAASLPNVLVHCVHGTWPRRPWRQLLWKAKDAFCRLRSRPHPERKKRCWFEPDSDLEKALLKKLGSDSCRVRFERFLWSGNNSFSARKNAAQELRWYLAAWRQALPGARHLILAHSHGGTVAVKAVDRTDTTDNLAQGIMTLGTPFVRLVNRGPKKKPSKIQAAVGMSLPAICLIGAPILAGDVLQHATAASTTTMWGALLLLAFLALVLRHVALAAIVLGIVLVRAYFVGEYVVFTHLLLFSTILAICMSWLARRSLAGQPLFRRSDDPMDPLGLSRSIPLLVQHRALHLPCTMMALRTPGDEASLVIGLGQALERLFHLWTGALSKRPFAGRPARFHRVLRVAVPVLCLLIGVVLVVTNDWVPGIQGLSWWEVLLLAVGYASLVVSAASVLLILPWVLPGILLSVLAGPEALWRPAITGVDAEPLPFAEPESLMTLVIDVEAGREQTKGLNHKLYDVQRIHLRIACWIQKALEEVMHDHEDLRDLREVKEESKGQEGVPLESVVSDLGL